MNKCQGIGLLFGHKYRARYSSTESPNYRNTEMTLKASAANADDLRKFFVLVDKKYEHDICERCGHTRRTKMADFCKQCSKELFDSEENDFSGIITQKEYDDGFAAIGLCEGCSGGEFDHEGNCLGHCNNPEHEEN